MGSKEKNLADFNEIRIPDYRKNSKDEQFLIEINRRLHEKEIKGYGDYQERYPFVFVFGAPRSGTTLLTQVIASSLEIGYINNLTARFWLAPVTGIRLSQIIFGNERIQPSYKSDYASTKALSDIHEFGYFWRFWLKKDLIENNTHPEMVEDQIDWKGLKRTLVNMQQVIGKGLCMKNVFGAFHINRFVREFKNILFVYIKRDPLDNAISILTARKKFFGNTNTWWSTFPPQYNMLKELDPFDQIAGQIHYLNQFYENSLDRIDPEHYCRFNYEELCKNPKNVLNTIRAKIKAGLDYEMQIVDQPPKSFIHKSYSDSKEKELFLSAFKKLK